jgi:hypothetical protein
VSASKKSQGALVGQEEIRLAGVCSDKRCTRMQVRFISVNLP